MCCLTCHPFTPLIFTLLFQKSTIDDPDYVAAVVSYTPAAVSNKSTPQKIVKENLKNYLDLIHETKDKNVDILVFPEATLNYWGYHLNRSALLEIGVHVPEIDMIPANDPSQSEIMKEISTKAAENQMYILINVIEVVHCRTTHLSEEVRSNGSDIGMNIESDANRPRAEAFIAEPESEHAKKDHKQETCDESGKVLYNTNVVFDRNGSVVSKYRKFNLFNEKGVAIEEKPELATFITDFGIQFGHFICFDLIFKKPAMK